MAVRAAVDAASRTIAVEDRWRRLTDRDVWFFRDHYIHEPAAYALSELIGLEVVFVVFSWRSSAGTSRSS